MAPAIKPEDRAREKIDEQLSAAGWKVQSRDDVNLSAARGVAVREFKMAPKHGIADYLLFVDGEAVGALEAKKKGFTLSGVEPQAVKYSEGLPATLDAPVEPLPFLYLSTGVETQFINLLDPHPRSRRVYNVHQPDTVAEWMQADALPAWIASWKRRPGAQPGELAEAEPPPRWNCCRAGVFFETKSSKRGTSIRKGDVERLELPLPPVREQRRIVKAIESYLTRLDATVETLKRVQANLKRYRASVLKAAVEGRLVPTEAELARREGREYEPASKLLERVLAERRRRWEEAELAKMRVKGKEPKNDGWKTRYKEAVLPDASNLPELPEGWCWASLGQLSWSSSYGTSKRCTENGRGEPVLRIPNIADGKIDSTDLKYARHELGIPDLEALGPGDFLVIRTNGSRNLIARAALVDKAFERPYFFASYLIRFRLVASEVIGSWLLAYWHSPDTRSHLEGKAATSAGQYNVSMKALSSEAVPLPPAAEQKRLAEHIQDLLTLAGHLGAEVRQDVARCHRLRQAILKWAFEGKLVDQDPNDEPSSVLLDRIRAERQAKGKKPRRSDRRKHREASEQLELPV